MATLATVPVAVVRARFDSPGHAQRVRGAVHVRGWAVDGDEPAAAVELWLGDERWGRLPVELPRPDVLEAHGVPDSALRCGFEAFVGVEVAGHVALVLRRVGAGTGDEPLDVRHAFASAPRGRIALEPVTGTGGVAWVAGGVEVPGGERVASVRAGGVRLLHEPGGGFSGVVEIPAGADGIDAVARLVDGEPIAARLPASFTPAPPEAVVESTGAVVEGWVRGGERERGPLPAGGAAPVAAEVVALRAGAEVARGRADRSRPDLVGRGPAAVRCGFALALPPGDGEVVVEARPVDTPAPPAFDGPPARVVREAPSVTFLVPAHGNSALTRRCLDAIVATTPAGLTWEAIVADDASTDDTWDVLQAAAAREPRIRPRRNERNLHYVRTINAAAPEASGDVLVFLNNDSEPRPGWLEPLLATLEDERDAGLAGGTLVHPDGLLQEAGCLVFRDGTILNVGRGMRPDHPLFRFARDVDYVSFALAAIPRGLFEQIGGLDERYAPLYYDDVDCAFAVRAAGRRVLFQPRSVVVHHEGASLTTERPEAPPHRDTFVGKWGAELAGRPEHPGEIDDATLFRLVAGGRPRAIVLSAGWPSPDAESVAALRDAGCAVAVLAVAPDGPAPDALAQAGVAAYAAPLARGARAEHLAHPAALLEAMAAAVAIVEPGFPWAPDLVRANAPGTAVVADADAARRALARRLG